MKSLISKVSVIQTTLSAPKNQRNNFGNYNYRSCEDILEGLKSVLDGLVVTVTDEMVMVGDRIYVKAVATITDGEYSLSNTGFARESLIKKGMDESQITGAASSYARKYALNGLFLIDDNKDADSMDNSGAAQQPVNKSAPKSQQQDDNKPWYDDAAYQADLPGVTEAIRGGMPPADAINQIAQKYKIANKYRDLIKAI